MKIGDELAPLPVGEITKAQIAEYSRVSADPNPMHTDEALAQQMGYPTVYAQGMLGMAFLSRFVCARAGGIGKLRRIKVRFATMTWPGESITCRGKVTAVEERDGKRLVLCEIRTENQDGEAKVVGTATFEA